MGFPAVKFHREEDRVPIDVFIVSPNANLRQELHDKLGLPRWNVVQAGSGAEALEILRNHAGGDGVLLMDLVLPDLEPNEFHGMVKLRYPNTQILTLNSQTGQLLIGTSSPTTISTRLVNVINNGEGSASSPLALVPKEASRIAPESKPQLRGMIGESNSMLHVYAITRTVAARDTTVLVTGESGTGKELIAQEIHLISPRRKQPFVVLNCSAIPEALLEAELFGYAKGAFTGAVQSRLGRVQAAHNGTLFLDEIGDMPLSLQSKLLRFLEQGEVQRLGGVDNLKVNVRVVAATNADLKKMITQQQFREDLYYRLAIFPIHLPPLRDRSEDLEDLAGAFATRFYPGVVISREAMQVLVEHPWPGNVRELRNVIERATIMVGSGREIKAEHIFL